MLTVAGTSLVNAIVSAYSLDVYRMPLSAWYLSTNPLVSGLSISAWVAVLAWVFGVLTGDCSQVDRAWSLLPPLYAWHFFAHAALTGTVDARLFIMALLASVWGARLTYNFARKGGYSGAEDYRWPILRARMPRIAFEIVHVIFIAWFQNLLLLLLTLPNFVAYQNRGVPLNLLDFIASYLVLFFILLETVADQQQWVFQTHKHKTPVEQRVGDYLRGFCTSGLFAHSRHPNFFAEQSVWVCFYFFSVAASGAHNASALGAAILILLFQASTHFTEQITVQKHPLYRDYQRSTSCLVPWRAAQK